MRHPSRAPRAGASGSLCIFALLLAAPVFAADPPLTSERIAAGLNKPVGLTHRPGDTSRLYVIEQHSGAILVFVDQILQADPVLEIADLSTGSEQGLLGLAFHPDPADDRLFVYLTRSDGDGVLRSYRLTDPDRADPASGRDLLVIPQPQSNHNGGWLAFGPHDGFLYLGLGDGGGGGDDDGGHGTIGNAQATANLLGAILRLDVDVPPGTPGDPSYLIPAGNPSLVGIDHNGDPAMARPEILHYGLRNPWRCGFDSSSGDLYIGDVGQNKWEELSYAEAGSSGINFGWRVFEGDERFKSGDPVPDPAPAAPIHVYDHGDGRAVVGGAVYRGAAMPDLQGTYFFADYTSGRIWSLRYDGGTVSAFTDRSDELVPDSGSIDNPASFGTDANGECYICDRDGEIFRIVPATGDQPPAITSDPVTTAVVDVPYSYQVVASASPAPNFVLTSAPSGMSIDPDDGLISWTPSSAGDAPVTVEADNGVGSPATQSFTVTVAALRPAEHPPLADLVAGLEVSRYAGQWSALPEFDSLVAASADTVSDFTIGSGDHYALRFTGFLAVPQDGVYTFTTRSDDGSALFIGDRQVVDNDGLHGPESVSGSIALAAGRHALTVTYFEADGGEVLEVRWDGPGTGGEVAIPPAALYRYADPYGRDHYPAAAPYVNMPASADGSMPATLSQTGAFADLVELRPSPGVLPYRVNSPLWSDGAVKRRWIALPVGERIAFDPSGNWGFPAGTVLIKHFEVGEEAKRLETRLLVVTGPAAAYGVTYRWRADGSDADLLRAEGLTTTVTVDGGSRTWRFPSRQDCLQCHTGATGRVLGVRSRQLNGDLRYPSTGRSDNQLRSWNHLGLFDPTIAEDEIAGYERLVAVTDESASLTERVRSYIDANCMMCHQPDVAPTQFDARYSTPLAEQGLLDGAVNDPLGIADARVVAPGAVHRSLLHHRLASLDPAERMPPLASHRRHEQALDAIVAWIAESGDGPTITTAPSATPDPVTGVSAELQVGAASGGDPSALTYEWSMVTGPAAAPLPGFSPNGDQTAAASTITFGQAGDYRLQVLVRDDAGGSTLATFGLQVVQTPTSVQVGP